MRARALRARLCVLGGGCPHLTHLLLEQETCQELQHVLHSRDDCRPPRIVQSGREHAADGSSPVQWDLHSSQRGTDSSDCAYRKQTAIKNACQLAFDGYQKYAFGHDEIRPVSQRSVDPFGRVGMTIVDALDTLYIMGLSSEYSAARDWISDNLMQALNKYAPQSLS